MIENGSIYIKLKILISWGFKSFTRLQYISAFILPKLVHDMVRQKKVFVYCLWHCSQRDCKGKMKEGIGWNLKILGVTWEFYLMFLSQEIYKKLCQIFAKIYISKILYKNRRFKPDHIQQMRTQKTTISKRSLKNLALLLLLF